MAAAIRQLPTDMVFTFFTAPLPQAVRRPHVIAPMKREVLHAMDQALSGILRYIGPRADAGEAVGADLLEILIHHPRWLEDDPMLLVKTTGGLVDPGPLRLRDLWSVVDRLLEQHASVWVPIGPDADSICVCLKRESVEQVCERVGEPITGLLSRV